MTRSADVVTADGATLRIDYFDPSQRDALLADPQLLALFDFQPGHSGASADPRQLRVGLQAYGQPRLECWRSNAAVHHGRDHELAWCSDGELAFGALQIDEAAHGGIAAAAEYGYRRLAAHLAGSAQPHLLRIWNYFDAIVDGDGDDERYRQFCVGRVRGIGTLDHGRLPAATAIGRCDGVRSLQLYWLSARSPGTALENPRQLSAYHYPRQYGPQSPSFARAMLPPAGATMPLLLSGTASIVGHQTRHPGQLLAQVDETLANLAALRRRARAQRPTLAAEFGADSRLKVYVANADDLPAVDSALQARLPPSVPYLLLHGVVCRRDLRMEIDGVHG